MSSGGLQRQVCGQAAADASRKRGTCRWSAVVCRLQRQSAKLRHCGAGRNTRKRHCAL